MPRYPIALISAFLLACAVSSAAQAQATTYTYNGGTFYDTFTPASAGDCTPISGCATFTSANRITGSFTTANPLPSNLSNAQVTTITAYSFTDGIITISNTDPSARIYVAEISTNGSGEITNNYLIFQKWKDGLAGPHGTDTANGTASNARFHQLHINVGVDVSNFNLRCTTVGTSINGAPDSCTAGPSDTFTSEGRFNYTRSSWPIGTWTIPAPPTIVPTMTEWAMILFGMLLVGGAALMAQRRRRFG